MITSRTSPRITVQIWLEELHRAATAEKAEFTADRLVLLSQAQLTMVASSDEADPIAMRKMVERTSFPEHARRYLRRNWALNIGIAGDADQVSKALRKRNIDRAIDQALEALKLSAGTMTSISGTAIVAMTDRAASALSDKGNPLHEMHGDGTGILLREILGMPGDPKPCENIRDPQVLECALLALERLDVSVAPEAYAALGVDKAAWIRGEEREIEAAVLRSTDAALEALGLSRKSYPQFSQVLDDMVMEQTRALREIRFIEESVESELAEPSF